MAMNYKEISGRLPQKYQQGGQLINTLVDSLVEQNMLPPALEDKEIEIPFEPLWRRQVDRLVTLGFPKELGISEEEYRASIPRFSFIRERYFNYFYMPAVVDPRVPIERQLELVGIGNDSAGIVDIVDIPKPYTSWMQIQECPRKSYHGSYLGREIDIATSLKGVRGYEATLLEAINFYLQYPDLFQILEEDYQYDSERYDWLFVPGSRDENNNILYLYHYRDRPEVNRGYYVMSHSNTKSFSTNRRVGFLTTLQRDIAD